MNFKRIGRILVCLLLICCLTFHAMIPRAEATSVAVPLIQKAAVVTGNPFVIVAATLVCLGIYKGVESGAFETVANNCVDALEAAGTWVKDGVVELLRTEDADGNASYYVDSGFMETVRKWLFDTNVVSSTSGIRTFVPQGSVYKTYTMGSDAVILRWCSYSNYSSTRLEFELSEIAVSLVPDFKYVTGSIADSIVTSGGNTYWYKSLVSKRGYIDNDSTSINNWLSGTAAGYTYISGRPSIQAVFTGYGFSEYVTDYDVSLGVIPSVPVDGTSARQWSEDYTDRGLKVYGGGSGNNNNDGKWFWKLMIPVVAADLFAMSQADEWSGETPKEFDDYTEVEELEIVSRPEVEFGQGVELAPVTTPTPDAGGNTGSDTGDDTEENPEVQTDYTTWFSKLYTVVENIQGKFEELPNKFQSWITDCKTAIEELPSKFADWFNNINSKLERLGEHLQTIGGTIVNGVSTLGEKILSLGQVIIEGVQNAISALFTPSPDYFTNKVEALKAKHHNIEKFTQLGNDFKFFFTGLGSKPPIIWIDLGAATGSYLWGGKQIFLDLTWYSQYKSKMDFILGAIIWLWLAWRVFLSVPGIINGASGVWGKYHRGGSRDDN